MAGSLYPVTTETELVTQASRPRSTTNAPLWYLIYNSLLIALSILAIAFWGFSAHAPLLYSFHFGQWLLANPKKSTIIWTVCGTIVAAILLFLLSSVLFLMVRQKARFLSAILLWETNISAGVSAAQESFGVRNASVRVVESLFKGSTGGVLPLGFEGISAFSNVKFMSWDPSMSTQSQQFNYSLTQQGLSADVTCQETSSTPIQTQLLKSMEVTNSNAGGTMELRRFIVNQGNCGSNHTFVVPGIGVVAPGFCQPDAMVKKYVLYLTPMGRYSRAPLSLPNMTALLNR
ncbi:unnamed protein product [Colletotrichum noveboracense]|uniref:Uncharacterized protein n=1 Tax=Colletotrichum noveboracense TaxID=2664923 RepID=A0A9W4RI17_9PEZI|nr:unnamed protein product [Colletotrichum noveboracense]